jgi:hypothetical protein
MGTVRREVIIDRPPDEVWARVGDPAGVTTWFPGMVDATVDGSVRTITTAAGLVLPEEIVTVDPILRRFQYRVTAPFFRHHLGTIDVFDLGDDRSLVAYSTDCDPDAMALIIGGAAGGALVELRRQLQPGPDSTPDSTPEREER